MKRTLSVLLLLIVPAFLFAQEAKQAPELKKNTLSAYRVWAKDGHNDALKAAIAAHGKKYHTGNWKWRVYEVLTGPDGGAFMISEGPNTWTEVESRADLGAEHMKDYDTNVAPHVEKSTSDMYATYQPDASTVEGAAFSTTKVLIRQAYLKPGRRFYALATLRDWKQVWEKCGVNIVTWGSFYSGEPRFIIAGRLEQGFADLDDSSVSFRKAADEIFGPGAYERLVADDAANYSRFVDEIIEYKAELSSK